jgi:hypothetical protein
MLIDNASLADGLNGFITHTDRGSGTVPKAYVNWVLFDEQFKFVKVVLAVWELMPTQLKTIMMIFQI